MAKGIVLSQIQISIDLHGPADAVSDCDIFIVAPGGRQLVSSLATQHSLEITFNPVMTQKY